MYVFMLIILMAIFVLAVVIKFKKKKYSFARELVKCESPIEESMLKALFEAGLQPYTQTPCGAYRIDIVLYSGKKKIAIECDGEEFHSSKEQKIHDERKNRFLEKNKWVVVRFSGKEIYRDVNWCVRVVRSKI